MGSLSVLAQVQRYAAGLYAPVAAGGCEQHHAQGGEALHDLICWPCKHPLVHREAGERAQE